MKPPERFRISIMELLLVVALFGILLAFFRHFSKQASSGRESVLAIEFSPDGKRLARASEWGVAVFEIPSGRLVKRINIRASALAFSRDSKLLAVGGADGELIVWSSAAGVRLPTPRQHNEWLVGLAFSPDSSRLFSASDDGVIQACDVATGKRVMNARSPQGDVNAMGLSPSGKMLATGGSLSRSKTHTIEIWNAESGVSIAAFNGPDWCYVNQLAFSPDSDLLATGLSIPFLRVWDVEKRAPRIVLQSAGGQDLVIFSPSGDQIVTSHYGGVRLWDTRTGDQLKLLDGHEGEVLAARFSRNGKRLTTAGHDASIRSYDLATGRQIGLVTGLTLRPPAVPWLMLAALGCWLALWCAFLIRPPSYASAILVAIAAIAFVANGLVVIGMVRGDLDDNPIGSIGGSLLAMLAVLASFGMSLKFQPIRRRFDRWAIAALIVAIACYYDLQLLAEIVASV